MKIGLLLPNSKYYPYIGSDLYLSLKYYLGNVNNYIIKDTHYGSPKENQQAIKELILYDGVNIIVGIIGYKSITAIKPIIHQTKTPLIICTPGDHPILVADNSPFIVHLSLNMFQSIYFGCKWSFNNIGKKYSYLGSFFEAGYALLFAANLASKKYNGNFMQIAITHKDKDSAIEVACNQIEQDQSDFIFMGYHGMEAREMMDYINGNHLFENKKLIVPPFFYEPEIIENTKSQIISVKSWTNVSGETETYFQTEHDRNASVFATLGNEAAMLIKHLINSGWNVKQEITPFLENFTLNSIRGKLTFDPVLNSFSCIYDLLMANHDCSNNIIIQEAEDYQILSGVDQEINGWTNTYLCN